MLPYLLLTAWLAAPPSALAYDVSASRPAANSLDASQFKDFANEWAFVAAPPAVGATLPAPPWRPFASLTYGIRSVRPAPGEDAGLRLKDYAWIAEPRLAVDPEPNIFVPFLHAGIGLPGGAQAGLLYGRSPNVNLQVAGIDFAYPFLTPSLSSPGLWARIAYVTPSRLPGLRLHLPTAGLYLTNEFVRVPSFGRPLTAHLHAGIQQMLVVAEPQELVEAKPLADGSEVVSKRGANTFPASTEFLVGLHFARSRWSLHADAGYATSESTFDGERRIRAFWSQAYKLVYGFD